MPVKVKNNHEKLLNGANTLADAVASTLGAKGRTVLIERGFGVVHPTKDGVTVASSITLEDPIENLSCSMIKAAAVKTADEAGDGTTTTTVLARALYEGAYDIIEASEADPVIIKEGIEESVKHVVKFIKDKSSQISDDLKELQAIATISANNDEELGKLISDAFKKVGREGVVKHKESSTSNSFIELKEGVSFNSGWMSPYFVTDAAKFESNLERVSVLLIDGDLEVIEPIVPLLEAAVNQGKSLLIIANKLSLNVINTLGMNHQKTQANILAVRAPYTGDKRKEFLKDLSYVTGAHLVTDPSGAGFSEYTFEMLGGCERVISKKDSTEIIGGLGTKENIESRAADLRIRLEEETDKEEKHFLKERISKLTSGVAILNIGANTTVELTEKLDRVEDAIESTKAALEEGIVAGGGITLLRASQHLKTLKLDDKFSAGKIIVEDALEAPIYQILMNAGVEEIDKIVSVIEVEDYSVGYDVKKESFEDMFEVGIIDPAKVCRIALESASSVACLLTTTSYTITEKR